MKGERWPPKLEETQFIPWVGVSTGKVYFVDPKKDVEEVKGSDGGSVLMVERF